MKLNLEIIKQYFNTHVLNRRIIANGCWEWPGCVVSSDSPYGQIKIKGKSYLVHRVSYMVYNNELVDSDLYVCHTCDNPRCFNPKHLFLGTSSDNAIDRQDKGRGKIPNNVGSNNGLSKLTEKEVLQIYSSNLKLTELSSIFNVSLSTLSLIRNKKRWAELTDLYDALILL